MDWNQRVVLITGASSGIGQTIAIQLAERGAHIFAVARRSERLEALKQRLAQAPGRLEWTSCDVSDYQQVKEAAARLTATYNYLDDAILCAGIGITTPARGFQASQFRRVHAVNVGGIANWLEFALPMLIDRPGTHLAAISSIAGDRGIPHMGAYSSSKAAVSTLMQSLRTELAGTSPTVLTIEPGFVKTDMTRDLGAVPFALEVDDAATRIVRALEANRQVIRFPLAMSVGSRFLNALPVPLYNRIMSRSPFEDNQ